MAEVVDLIIDPLRGERVAIELPIAFRVPPEVARSELGLPDWVDISDPHVARAVGLLAAARRTEPSLHLALLGGAAHRLRCLSSNRTDLGLRRPLHDIDIACLHKQLPAVREFLSSLKEREGGALQFIETNGDRIFNSLGEGRRIRLHMVLDQEGREIGLGTADLLADEFRFCHRFDLRSEILAAGGHHGTLSPALLLLTKLQFIQRIPGEDRDKVSDRVLGPFGRRDVIIGPEAKDVRDILALLLDHPVAEVPDGVSPNRLAELVSADWGLWRTVTLNLEMIARSPVLANLPDGPRLQTGNRIGSLRNTLTPLEPKRRWGFLRGQWWEEVDGQPAVDGKISMTNGPVTPS
ncbi:MAG: hypothetical protein WB947_03215 [Thermoplasmata archaeon]